MVSLFGRGFDSLQLHNLLECKPLTFRKLAASLCPASPVFSVFGDALGAIAMIKENPFVFVLFPVFICFYMDLQILVRGDLP